MCWGSGTRAARISKRFLLRSAKDWSGGPLHVYGPEGVVPALHMGLTAVVNILVYKSLKNYLVRQRPYILYDDIRCGSPPLDEYSFPSGHTLHAVSFSVIAIGYFPELAGILVPFMLLVALSRVVLGLHYPSDVLAGAVIGFALGRSSMALFGY